MSRKYWEILLALFSVCFAVHGLFDFCVFKTVAVRAFCVLFGGFFSSGEGRGLR